MRAGGDAALVEAVRRFDGFEAPSADALRLAPGPQPDSPAVDPHVAEAIERARDAIDAYHSALLRGPGVERIDRDGVRIEERRIAVRRVGLYVPGGRFPYPSTVLMTAVPARLAGVEEIVVATPPQAYRDSPVLRHVLDLVGVDEVWGMGGAHAVAALAYGTESIRPVDLIAGPGNAWVAAAKRHVASGRRRRPGRRAVRGRHRRVRRRSGRVRRRRPAGAGGARSAGGRGPGHRLRRTRGERSR